MPGVFLVDLLRRPTAAPLPVPLVWDSERKGVAPHLRRARSCWLPVGTASCGRWTTSPRACNGDGLAAALRAGAQVADLEFVQFHPTGMDLGRDPRPLASEALRGAGARLRDSQGEYLTAPVVKATWRRGTSSAGRWPADGGARELTGATWTPPARRHSGRH